jgi:cytochrome c oxidase subunit 2
MFLAASEYAKNVDGAMAYIIGFSIIMLLGVTFTMIYFVAKYYHKSHPKPKQTHGSLLLETVWIVLPTIIVISMFYVGYADYSENRALLDSEVDLEVEVFAKQFEWDFVYENGLNLDTLYVPVNRVTRFKITSYDVIHSFYLPAFRIKEDAVSGRINQYAITPNETGEFDVACAEYCGVSHWNMYTQIKVMPEDEFDAWYAENTAKIEAEKGDTEDKKTETNENEENTEAETENSESAESGH